MKHALADAFYNEDWDVFKKLYGKKPKNALEAEQLMYREAKKRKMVKND